MNEAKIDRTALAELRARLPDYLRMTGRAQALRGKIRCIDPGHSDSTPSMGYDKRRGRLHCFGCGKSFDLFDVVAIDEPECTSFPLQVRRVCEVLGVSVPEAIPARRSVVTPRASAEQDFTALMTARAKDAGFGGAVFAARGISQALCEAHRLFMWEGCAYLPVYREERCVAYCVRQPDGCTPRYRNSPGSMEIFGGDLLRVRGAGCIVVAESIFDALSAQMCGFAAVALCGVGNTGHFLELCAQCPDLQARRFLLAGDNDAAGRRMNRELQEGLARLGAKTAQVVLPDGVKDLNDALLAGYGALEDALMSASVRLRVETGVRLIRASRPASDDFDRGPTLTGIAGLDVLLEGGLYPGLYVLGAVSSLGKTSLALQMADAIAESGRDVLYFTLEMSGAELVSKSLSRISAQMDRTAGKSKGISAREVSLGAENPVLARAREAYCTGAGMRMFFVEEPVGVGDIARTVAEYRTLRGRAPVVVVDYLQILQPADVRGTDKQNTDRAVVALKRISREHVTSVLAISSFNRENYRSPVSMEAFKESGAVEYSSDVLLGLQPTGVGEPRFDMNAAKMRNPREVELVLLKNRTGQAYGVVPLRYYAKFSLFTER